MYHYLLTLVMIFCYITGHRRNCKAEYKPEKDLLTIQLLNCPTLDGDIRILFQTANKDVPKGRVCERMSCKHLAIIFPILHLFPIYRQNHISFQHI